MFNWNEINCAENEQEFKNISFSRNTMPESGNDCCMIVKTSNDLVIYCIKIILSTWKLWHINDIWHFIFYWVRDLHVKIQRRANLRSSVVVWYSNAFSHKLRLGKRKQIMKISQFSQRASSWICSGRTYGSTDALKILDCVENPAW